jgi:hypothetical protein
MRREQGLERARTHRQDIARKKHLGVQQVVNHGKFQLRRVVRRLLVFWHLGRYDFELASLRCGVGLIVSSDGLVLPLAFLFSIFHLRLIR